MSTTVDPKTTTEKQLLQMLQALFIERFKLKYHQQDARESGYALVVAKEGPKLKESTVDRMHFDSPKPTVGRPIVISARKCPCRY
jgi:uncharacterized protein (TIGR03435 family)